jgi:GxxExxY protein
MTLHHRTVPIDVVNLSFLACAPEHPRVRSRSRRFAAAHSNFRNHRIRFKTQFLRIRARQQAGVAHFAREIERGMCGERFASCYGMFVPSDPQTFQIIGAAMEVHRRLSRGLFEGFYCDALEIEFSLRNVPFEPQCAVQLEYKGHPLKRPHHMDFICFNEVVVEVKAVSALTPADEAQLLNYLAMTKMKRGLLLNFGAKSFEHKRMVM